MVTNVQDEDRPKPWLKKKIPVAPSRRETRTSAKTNAVHLEDEDPLPSKLPSGSGRGRGRKGKSKVVHNDKNPKITQSMPSAAANVVLGRAENAVQSVDERRRKTDEDAQTCGRITRTVTHPATRKSCPTATALITANVEHDDNNSPPMSSAVPNAPPNTSGITINHWIVYCFICIQKL